MAETLADNQTITTSSDLASVSTIADDTADMLDSQLSNKLVSEVINTAENASQQMDINDAINAAAQDMAPADLDKAASIDSDAPLALGDLPTMPLTLSLIHI